MEGDMNYFIERDPNEENEEDGDFNPNKEENPQSINK